MSVTEAARSACPADPHAAAWSNRQPSGGPTGDSMRALATGRQAVRHASLTADRQAGHIHGESGEHLLPYMAVTVVPTGHDDPGTAVLKRVITLAVAVAPAVYHRTGHERCRTACSGAGRRRDVGPGALPMVVWCTTATLASLWGLLATALLV
jgi:hypothetical protein